jgi:hypothetical protein
MLSNAAEIYDLLMNIIIMSWDAGVKLGSDGAPVEYGNAYSKSWGSSSHVILRKLHFNIIG